MGKLLSKHPKPRDTIPNETPVNSMWVEGHPPNFDELERDATQTAHHHPVRDPIEDLHSIRNPASMPSLRTSTGVFPTPKPASNMVSRGLRSMGKKIGFGKNKKK